MYLFSNVLVGGLAFSAIGFLMGSIPFGLIYSLIRGVDIRKIGSGNIGATNVSRQFGFWQGFVPIILLDMIKGVVPIVLFNLFVDHSENTVLFDWMQIFIGTAAVLGHVFSPWLAFKGGKGVATSGGMLFALNPLLASSVLGAFIVLFFTVGKRIVGRCSVMSAVLLPIFAWFVVPTTFPLKIMSIFMGVVIVSMHRKNIKEWISGEDLRKKQDKGTVCKTK